MTKKYLLVLCTLFFLQAAIGQKVSSIKFTGIERTKVSYLLQFVETTIGETLVLERLQKDQQRLSNLEILAKAAYAIDTLEAGQLAIEFQCAELFTLLPIFNFGSLTDNSWLQIGLSEANLFGRGHKAFVYYQYYDRNSVAAQLTLNRINRSKWGVSLNFTKWSTIEPLFFEAGVVSYNYDNFSYGGELSYDLSFRQRLVAGLTYFTEEYEAVSATVSGAPAYAFKRKMLYKFRHSLDHINYHFFYQDGLQNVVNAQIVCSFNEDPFFWIFFNDLKYFMRIGERGNFASRLRIGLSSNEDSPFAPFVLDSYLNIRGVGNRVDRGTGTLVGNVEYRHAFIDKNRIAIQLDMFADIGSWRKPGGELSDFSNEGNQVFFAGIGTRFILKRIHQAVLRVDYGFDMKDLSNQGLVIGLGQYF